MLLGKIIKGLKCFLVTNIKLIIIKLFHFKLFHFHFLNLILPSTEFDFNRNSKVQIGKMVRCGKYCRFRVRENSKLVIGDNSYFNDGAIIVCRDNITIGKNFQSGPNLLIYDHDHDYKNEKGLKTKQYLTAPVAIGNNVWVGANVIILRGTTIGDNCVIAAGAVIKGNISSNTVVVQKRENVYRKVD